MRRAGLWVAAVMAAGMALPGFAAPDSHGQQQRQAVLRLAEAVAADEAARFGARALMAEAGFALPPAADVTPIGAPTGASISTGSFDLRIALGRLAQAFGHEDNSAVLAAQAGRGPQVRMIESGSLGLADLAALMGEDAVPGTGGLEVRAPLIIRQGAELRIGPGERLDLSRSHGAFVLNFGRLVLEGAVLRGVGGESPDNAEFAPFVTTTGAGTLHVRDAEIADLGFGSTVKYSGLSVIRGALDRPAAGSFIANSKIARIKRISVQAAEGLVIDGNRIQDAGSAALVILHSRDTRVTANLLAGRSVTNAIRVLDGSSGTVLAGNAILEGDRVGILIKNAPDRTRVEGNIVWARDGSGIKLDRARCARVSGNYVIGNRQKGIEVRHSLAAHLDGNVLVSNKSAGIWVSGQPAGAVTRIEDNVLDANGAGVATATAEAILLEGNDFTRQFPRFLAGDLGRQARYIASDITGRAPIALDAAGVTWAPFRTVPEALAEDPDLSEDNPMFKLMDQPGLGRFPVPGSPVNYTGFARQEPAPAAHLGAQTEEVLSEVAGLTDTEIQQLFDRGVVQDIGRRKTAA